MSKLDRILNRKINLVKERLKGKSDEDIVRESKAKTKQQVKDLILELIGEDEESYVGLMFTKSPRDSLRDELRQKVEEL